MVDPLREPLTTVLARLQSLPDAVLAVVGVFDVVRTRSEPPAREPARGMIHPSDLGRGGWRVGTLAGDVGPATVAVQPGCQDELVSGVDFTRFGTGSVQVLRGKTPGGAEWLVDEAVLTLDAEGAHAFGRQLRTGVGCAAALEGRPVLAANESVLVTGTFADVSGEPRTEVVGASGRPMPEPMTAEQTPMTAEQAGAVGQADVSALVDRTWIHVAVYPGGPRQPRPGPRGRRTRGRRTRGCRSRHRTGAGRSCTRRGRARRRRAPSLRGHGRPRRRP